LLKKGNVALPRALPEMTSHHLTDDPSISGQIERHTNGEIGTAMSLMLLMLLMWSE
jgi:hypothetical protein